MYKYTYGYSNSTDGYTWLEANQFCESTFGTNLPTLLSEDDSIELQEYIHDLYYAGIPVDDDVFIGYNISLRNFIGAQKVNITSNYTNWWWVYNSDTRNVYD